MIKLLIGIISARIMSMSDSEQYTKHDAKLPLTMPFYGQIKDITMKHILSIIGSDVYYDPLISTSAFRELLRSEKKATITYTKTNDAQVQLNKRDCFRKSFYYGTMVKLQSYIMRMLTEDSVKFPFNANDVTIELSHGDIMLYEEDGFFKAHRDGDLIKSPDVDQYSVMLCIDASPGSDIFGISGATIVYLPSFYLRAKNIIEKNPEIVEYVNNNLPKHFEKLTVNEFFKQKNLFEHIYPQSSTPNQFVVFPANALHEGYKVSKCGFKLVLKFDMYAKKKSITNKQAIGLLTSNTYCSCFNCIPHLYDNCMKHLVVPRTFKDKISRLQICHNFQQINCMCDIYTDKDYPTCSCTCRECINNMCSDYAQNDDNYNNYDNDYDNDDDDDEFCNGWDDNPR